jgi:hypothetical protein
MGGWGSGPRESGKDLVETCTSIDIRQWQRLRLLNSESHFSWCWQEAGVTVASINVQVKTELVVLTYKARCLGQEWQDIDDCIGLSFSSCHYGGQRPWFLCPMAECGRAVAVLYLSGLHFLCRRCHSLAYTSQREGRAKRALRRGQKIRKRLGGSTFVVDPFPEKPRRMRWATYGRLIEKANEAELERLN